MSLQRKVFLVTAALITVVFAATLALVDRQVRSATVEEATRHLATNHRAIADLTRARLGYRTEKVRRMALDPPLIAAFERGDAASLQAALAGLAAGLPDNETMLATTLGGTPLASRGLEGVRLPASLGAFSPFSRVLSQQAPQKAPQKAAGPGQGLWLLGGQVYEIVAAPVVSRPGGRTLGVVALGLMTSDEMLDGLAGLTQTDLLLVVDGRVAASSLPAGLARSLTRQAAALVPGVPARLAAGGATYLASRHELPLEFGGTTGGRTGGGTASRVVLRSLAGADRLSARILRGLLLVGLGAGVLCFVCAWLGARRITRPLHSLSSAMAEMARSGELRPDFESVDGDPEVKLIEGAFRQLVVSLEESRRARERSYVEAVGAVVTAADARDHETTGHSFRVAHYAVTLAKAMGIRGETLKAIEWGSLLHDVGKMVVPDEILRKVGPLTEAEWHIMRQHPNWGFDMLAEVGFLQQPALEIVYSHHERWDGAGYPRRLAGESIPLAARIFAVVDTYDAITSDRPYRKAHSHQAAMAELQRVSGLQLDPRVVEAFRGIPEVELRRLRELCKRIHPGLSLPPDLLDAMTEPDTGVLETLAGRLAL